MLLGFDFPIGVPVAYGARTGCANFPQFLAALEQGVWSRFFDVASQPAEIGIGRPFYPALSKKGVSRSELVAGLDMHGFGDLLRTCERRTEHRQAACSLFWTLGGNQVGKGAASGWREVIRPAMQRGARLWPFDGPLEELATHPGVVLAETYPAEAFRMVGAPFSRSQSKRRQADRCEKSTAILQWAARHAVDLTEEASAAIEAGFGAASSGEDQFDALLGLLKMIEIVDGRRPAQTEHVDATSVWEGWILGR